jgi:hypothetical protein
MVKVTLVNNLYSLVRSLLFYNYYLPIIYYLFNYFLLNLFEASGREIRSARRQSALQSRRASEFVGVNSEEYVV